MLYLWLFKCKLLSSAGYFSPHQDPSLPMPLYPPLPQHGPRLQGLCTQGDLLFAELLSPLHATMLGLISFCTRGIISHLSFCPGQNLHGLASFSDITSSKKAFVINQPEMMSPSGECPNTWGVPPSWHLAHPASYQICLFAVLFLVPPGTYVPFKDKCSVYFLCALLSPQILLLRNNLQSHFSKKLFPRTTGTTSPLTRTPYRETMQNLCLKPPVSVPGPTFSHTGHVSPSAD